MSDRSESSGRRLLPLAVLAALLVALTLVLANSIRRIDRQNEVGAVIEAAESRRWSEVLVLSEGLAGADADGQLAARARCDALLATGRPEECAELIVRSVGRAQVHEWIPEPLAIQAAINAARTGGQADAAVRLAMLGHEVHPEDLRFLELLFETRIAVEGEQAVIADYESRQTPDASAFPMRVLLSAYKNRSGDFAGALAVLGDTWPPADHAMFEFWVQNRERAQAQSGDFEAFDATFRKWRELRGPSVEIDAYYAVRMTAANLTHPAKTRTELLEAVLEREQEIGNPDLHATVYRMLIGQLMLDRQLEQALAWFDRGAAQLEIPSITRSEIERAIALGERGRSGADRLPAQIRFIVPDRKSGDVLLVSDLARREPDAGYEAHPLRGLGTVEVHRDMSPWPERWVLRDRDGRTRASGRVWADAAQTTEVVIARGEARPPLAYTQRRRPAGDGRTRVHTIVLDCADWRITQYLRSRGELPFFDHLLEHGTVAVLESDPPFTAVAMESLVWPDRGEQISFVGLVHRIGMEIGGLESVGVNPFDFLAGVLPSSPSLFDVVGAGERVAANMLFSHGNISAGHHAETVGPRGRRGRLDSGKRFRPLLADEIAAMPVTRSDAEVRGYVESIGGEFDAAQALVSSGEVDLLVMRIEALDILTHRLVHELLATGQDDGRPALLGIYRYIDRRLADVYEAMDRDDVLIVMSDHGVRMTTQHESDAMFVAIGAKINATRIDGRPDFIGVPAALVDLFGIEAPDWPRTGLELRAEERVAAHRASKP